MIRLELFTSPGCRRCAAVEALIADVVGELGNEHIDWRVVDISEEVDRAVACRVLSTPAIALDGELVFSTAPSRRRLRNVLRERLERGD